MRGASRLVTPPPVARAMLSTYEAAYTYLAQIKPEDPQHAFWHMKIADGYVPRPMVFGAALAASWARSVVEAPFEYAKVS